MVKQSAVQARVYLYLHIITSSARPSAVGKANTDRSRVSSIARSMLLGCSMNVLAGAAGALPICELLGAAACVRCEDRQHRALSLTEKAALHERLSC